MKLSRRWSYGLLGAAALLTVGLSTAAVYAQTPQATDTVTATVPTSATAAFGWGRNQAGMAAGVDHDALLADALGITVEELQAARTKARDAAIDKAVADGWITQKQADQLKLYGPVRLSLGLERWGGDIDENALLADALGISVDKLTAAQEKVFTDMLDQAVKDGRLTQAQAGQLKAEHDLQIFLAPRMKTAYSDGIKAAVEAGVITQEQADQLQNGPGLFGLRLFGRGLWDSGLFGPDGFGGHPGRGRMGGGMFGPFGFERGGHGRGWGMPGMTQPAPQDQATPQGQSSPSQAEPAGSL